MVRAFVLLVMAMAIPLAAVGQATEHQRIGVEKQTAWELTVESGTALRAYAVGELDAFLVEAYAALELLLSRTWSMSATMPLSARVLAGSDVSSPAASGIGDASLSLGWTGRAGDSRLGITATVVGPTGAWEPYEVPGGPLATGSGRWSAGLSVSAARILDPVVLGLNLGYTAGLPRAERFGTSWEPGTVSLGLGVTEVLNDSVGYSIRLGQSLVLPTVVDGVADIDGLSYGVKASLELFVTKDDFTARIGFTKGLGTDAGPGTVSLTLSYRFEPRKAEGEDSP